MDRLLARALPRTGRGRIVNAPRIMVVTEVVADAALIMSLLRKEFENVVTSTDAQRAVEDFEAQRPTVLILAFNTLEKAERYYLGLYRLSPRAQVLPHRTLILCNKDELRRVYELCKKRYFDDYILFWPMRHDAQRLPLAVHQALRQIAEAGAGAPGVREFAAQARRIASLEALLEQSLARGGERVEAASQSLARAERDIGAALDGFSRRLAEGGHADLVEVRDRAGLEREIGRLKRDEVDRHLRSAAAAVQPVRQWVGAVKEELAPQLESARALGALAESVPPVVLVVDDDVFQHQLLAKMLAETNLKLHFVVSGSEALDSLHRWRPDLILMDVMLPDIDGVEATRRLKSVEQFADVPVIMITGQSGKDVVVDSLKAGAADFVVKPFDKSIVQAKIRKFLTTS